MVDILKDKYINPYTDFGFKRLFGTEVNKALLISFLNALLEGTAEEIADVQYLNSENLGDGYADRRSVFDVYCMSTTGSRFIVEMQKAEQSYFKDRSVYYATTPIRQQARKGMWDYRLDNVYTVGILNFEFSNNEYPVDSFRHVIQLKDVEDNHVFYDKLTFVYLEMPKFNKGEDELVTMFDKWMYALRNLYRLLDRPKALQDRIFDQFFRHAEIAKYDARELGQYEESLKEYWDYNSIMQTAEQKGERNALIATARRMKALGMDAAVIAQVTGLKEDDIADT